MESVHSWGVSEGSGIGPFEGPQLAPTLKPPALPGDTYFRLALFMAVRRLRENLFFDPSSTRVLDPNFAPLFPLIFQVFIYLTRFLTENRINCSV